MLAAPSRSDPVTDGRLVARTWGWLFLAGPGVGLLTLALPAPRDANRGVFVSVCAVGLAIGAALVSGRADHWPVSRFWAVGYFATVIVSVGVYCAGAPESGFHFFYLWVTPYAYRFDTARQAAAQTAFVGVASAVVLTLQARGHPDLGPPTDLAAWWLVSMATIVMVGMLVRRLTLSVRSADARFRQGFTSAPVGILLLTRDLTIVDANDAAARIAHRSVGQLLGTSLVTIIHPDDVEAGRTAAVGALTGLPFDVPQRLVHPDGSLSWVRMTGRQIADPVHGSLLFVHLVDVSAERQAADLLRWQATHDPLTALPNRLALLERLGDLLGAHGEHRPVGVVVADLDRFRHLNDNHGHRAGDLVLQQLAGRVAALAGGDVFAARAGGDAFALAAAVEHAGEVDELGRRLAAALGEPVRVGEAAHHPTATVGVAIAAAPADPENLLWEAQMAATRAKTAAAPPPGPSPYRRSA